MGEYLALALAVGADAVWLLNNDTLVAPDALLAMRNKLFSCERPGLCGPLVRYMEKPDVVQCRAGGWTNPWTCLSSLNGNHFSVERALVDSEAEVEAELNFIYGAAVMVSRDFLTTVGMMDERFFLYCEEQDWAARAAGRFTLGYAGQAHVWHKEGASTGWSSKAENIFGAKYLIHSRLLLTLKHNPAALPLVCLSIAFAAVRKICRRLKNNVLS
jgi:GT2 family glycosyltransferase